MKKLNTRDLVFMAFYVALAVVLSYLNEMIPIIKMPNGGSVEYSLVALIIASYHLGWKKGVAVALLSYVVEFLFGFHSYMLNPMQVCFDYIFPIGMMGLTSLLPKVTKDNVIVNVSVSVTVIMIFKYLSHVTSGALFYATYNGLANGSWAGWVFSFGYNASYCIPTWFLAVALVPILVKKMKTAKPDYFKGI